jgi:hypothetical protein
MYVDGNKYNLYNTRTIVVIIIIIIIVIDIYMS